jgi:putative SOS response-associated peptidase YedK
VWGQGEDRVLTCSVVTMAALGPLTLVHSRMPLVLPPERWNEWLAPDRADRERLLAPPPADFIERLEVRPVGSAVGDVRNDGPSLTARIAAPGPGMPVDGHADLTLF